MRTWLRDWLGITGQLKAANAEFQALLKENKILQAHIDLLLTHCEVFAAKIKTLEAKLELATYQPPPTPEKPKPEVVQCRTMREFNAIVEREQEQYDAVG